MSEQPTGSGADAPFAVQVTIDCAEPHVLADWWAETLRWEVEPQPEDFIRSMIEQGHASEDDTITHRGHLVWKEGCAIRPAGEAVAGQPRMLVMAVPEPKTVKNRVHLDLRPPDADADEIERLRAELVERGATRIGEGRQGPHTWAVMTDPAGNEFCL